MKTLAAVTATVYKGIADGGGLALQEVKPESRISEDLHLDSLELLELVMWAEEEFEIEVLDESVEAVGLKVADFVTIIWNLYEAKWK